MDKICLVFDIDETILQYGPDHFSPDKFDYEENLIGKDRIVIRPGLKKFIEFVKSNGEKTILGIWTYGTQEYAEKVAKRIEQKYNNSEPLFKFVYSRENMSPWMLDNELDFIVDKHPELGITKANTFLVDNRPANVIHRKNRNNGIIVESFNGDPGKKDAKMFEKLEAISKGLLTNGCIPNKYMTHFYVGGEKTPLASIGSKFDDGLTPVSVKKTRKQKKRGGNKRTRCV